MLIYIVEDDTDIRELETYALKNSGYEVKSFGQIISEVFFLFSFSRRLSLRKGDKRRRSS